jgi:hypothetical protein
MGLQLLTCEGGDVDMKLMIKEAGTAIAVLVSPLEMYQCAAHAEPTATVNAPLVESVVFNYDRGPHPA